MGKVQVLKTGLSLVRKGANSLPKESIAPKTLGYIAPNGTINFQNEESAVKYIFNRLHESLTLPQEQQFERLIVKKNSSILGEIDGTNANVNINDLQNKNVITERLTQEDIERDLEVFHSHPDSFGRGRTNPISPLNSGPSDLEVFLSYKLKKIVAVNSNGEFNSIEATKEFSLEKFWMFWFKFSDTYFSKILSPELFKKLKKYQDIVKQFMEQGKNLPNNIQLEIEQLNKQMIDIEQSVIDTEKRSRIIHQAYKHANNYGMKYETNFSNLLENNT